MAEADKGGPSFDHQERTQFYQQKIDETSRDGKIYRFFNPARGYQPPYADLISEAHWEKSSIYSRRYTAGGGIGTEYLTEEAGRWAAFDEKIEEIIGSYLQAHPEFLAKVTPPSPVDQTS